MISIFVLLSLLLPTPTYGYFTSGQIISDKPWVFLDKFCFNPATDDAQGVFEFDFVYPRNSTMTLLVYWYADHQWRDVYQRRDALTCQQKISKSQNVGNRFDIYQNHWRIPIEPGDSPRNMFSSHFDALDVAGIKLAHSKGRLTFSSNRERWYYFALSNCDSTCTNKDPNHCNGEIVTTYKMTFSNGQGWDAAVTADVQGLAESSIALFIFWICMASCVLSVQLTSMSRRKMLHSTVKILVQALLWHILELFFAMIYYTNNINSGEPSTGLHIIYRICASVSETEIVLLLILLGKGWTVVRRKISPQGRVRITAFITVYACVQFAVVTWEGTLLLLLLLFLMVMLFTAVNAVNAVNIFLVLLVFFFAPSHVSLLLCSFHDYTFFSVLAATVGADPADITYLYESPPGFVLMCLRAYGLIWFLRAILITRVKYTRKRGFYWKFALLGSLWMIALPFQVGMANLVIAVHHRPKFVFAFSIVVNLLFLVAMFILFSPSRFNRSFPFHAKTSDMEARPPASTGYTSSGGGGGAAQQRGVGRPGARQMSGGPGGVEMTANGPIFRNPPAAITAGRNVGSAGRNSLSGGLAMGTPEERVRFSIAKIRSKITQLADHSDDLEFALDELDLHDWDSPTLKDADYDLPDSRNESDKKNQGSTGRMMESNTSSSGNNSNNNKTGKSGKRPRPAPPPEDD
jgi:hypothetical protein